MSAMKDTGIEWIGEIPLGWELRRIKTNFNILAGATPKSGEASFWDGGIPWITPADYTTEGVYVSAGHKSITEDGLNSCATSLIPEGSIIFSKRAPVGLVAINKNPLCTNQGCLSCVPKADVDAKYFYYVMSIYCDQFNLFASGTTFKEISTDAFANFKLPYPDYMTQKRISSFLDAKCAEIDALIAAKEKTNALLRERRQSIIYEAVTKGLNPNAPMKDSGVEWIGEIPEGWELKRLKYLGSMQIGLTYSPEEIVADGALVLRSSNIQDGKIVHADDIFVGKEIPEKLKVEEGDILICSRNGSRSLIGKNAVITEEFSGQTFGAFMTIFRGRLNFYIKYLLNSSVFDYYVGSFLTSTINQLTTSNLGNILVPVPSTEEEMWKNAEHIETECRTIDPIIAMNNETIKKLKEYRQSLIYEAVTGKIEV